MKTKKLFILVLAVAMLFAGFASVAFADSTIVLTVNNITAYPTAEGSIYFGQKINEGITLTGGEVQYNGVVVPGHFEFVDPEYRNSSATTYRPPMIFVPDDTEMYTSFDVPASKNTSFVIEKAIPVFIDENDTIPVATAVEAGAQLKTSLLSGASVKNPYYAEEPKALAGVWKWAQGTTVVNESGYYEARLTISGYERLYAQVYVEVLADFEIAEYPTIPELTYDANITWADVTLSGGKAVSRATGEEVAGVFTISEDIINNIPSPRDTSVAVVFTPANEDDGKAYNFSIPVTINRIPISFGPDHKGTSIDDPYIFEVAPFADMGEVRDILKYYHLNWPGTGSVQIEDYNGKAEHGRIYEYQVHNHNNSNYTGNIAYVKLVFATTEITPSIVSASGGGFKVDCAGHSVPGTFTVYCNGEEIATVSRKESYVFQCEVFTDEGGTFNIVAKYNPTENDYFVCNDAEVTYVVPAMHSVTNARSADNSTYGISMKVLGSSSFTARAGQTVELRATLDSFVCWTFKDADGNEVTLEGVDLNAKQNTFIMPDYDLFVSYKIQEDIDREEAIANCDHLCHSDNEFIQLFWNILNMFFRLLNVQQYCDCGELHYSAPLFNFG